MQPHLILDRDHLARYTLGDAALEQEVLSLFIGQIPETVTLLRESRDGQSWGRAAHTIKGSAKAIGAWKLAAAAERAERRADQSDDWDRFVYEIEVAVAEVRARIAAPA